MTQATSSRTVLALILLVPAFMASNFLVARSAPGIIGPHALAGQRWLLAGLLFGFLARDELRAHWRTLLADWPRLLVLGALGMWICGAWVYLAGQTTVATNMALIYALSPVLIALISHFWLHEAFGRVQACGVALALAGVVHVVLGGQWGALSQLRFAPGDAWVWCSVARLQVLIEARKRSAARRSLQPMLAALARAATQLRAFFWLPFGRTAKEPSALLHVLDMDRPCLRPCVAHLALWQLAISACKRATLH